MLDEYEARLKKVRQSIWTHPATVRLTDPDIAPQLLHRFLIEYCSLGVQITQPVDDWIRRAGLRTERVGLGEVGSKLRKHAQNEAGHHLMFIDDAKSLAEAYNTTYHTTVSAQDCMDQPPTAAMKRYIDLHEAVISSDSPFAQVAIELEVEGLSVCLGPELLAQLQHVLGSKVSQMCSFLHEHVALDVGHTKFNNALMSTLLEIKPQALELLADTGAKALGCYLDFVGECLDRAAASPELMAITTSSNQSVA